MFFKRKGYLRKEFDEKLLGLLVDFKNEWMRQKSIIDKSVEPSLEVITHLKIAEAKYFYLLKEAKKRNVNMKY